MRKLVLFPLLAIALSAQAASLPPWAGFPPEFKSDEAYEVVETFGKEEFPMPNDKPAITVEGKHYAAGLRAEPGLDENATWAKIRPALLAHGWKLVTDAGVKVLRMQTPHDAWLKVDIFGSDDVRVSMIEVAQQTVTLKLPPPGPKPESVAPTADFPYLGRLPGSQLKETQVIDGPMDVTTDNDKEPQLAGTGSIVKFYTVPQGVSVHQFLAVYRNALVAAGWAIVSISEPSDGSLLAHFGRNGRDVWAALHIGEDIAMRVADAGSASELARQLDRACHVPLYGIHFDFNKATLRADSDPALQQVLNLLQSAPSLSIEVQGHTDAIGNDAANQKLSEARAGAVRQWLTAHGVTATRLSAKGYGKTHPVASNDNDEGRARNRRVEIAKVGCGK